MTEQEIAKNLTEIRSALFAIFDTSDISIINSEKVKIALLTSQLPFKELDIPILTQTFELFADDLNKYLDSSASDTIRENLKRKVLETFGSLSLAILLFSQREV